MFDLKKHMALLLKTEVDCFSTEVTLNYSILNDQQTKNNYLAGIFNVVLSGYNCHG